MVQAAAMATPIPSLWTDILGKLEHPLQDIRLRAVKNIAFKLKSGLFSPDYFLQIPRCLKGLLFCVRAQDSSFDALYIIQDLIQKNIRIREALVDMRAIPYLEKVRDQNPIEGHQRSFQNVIDLLLQVVAKSTDPSCPSSGLSNTKPKIFHSSSNNTTSPEKNTTSNIVKKWIQHFEASKQEPENYLLTTHGWKFPLVSLTKRDEQLLFEFEVKFRMRTEYKDMINYCQHFREILLRDFPCEIFLQRPTILKHLLYLLQLPLDPSSEPPQQVGPLSIQNQCKATFGEKYYGYNNSTSLTSMDLFFSVLETLEKFIQNLKQSFSLYIDGQFQRPPSLVQTDFDDQEQSMSYPSRRLFENREEEGHFHPEDSHNNDMEDGENSWSFCGTLFNIMTTTLPLLKSAQYPRLHLLSFIQKTTNYLFERSAQPLSEDSIPPSLLDIARMSEYLRLWNNNLLSSASFPRSQNVPLILRDVFEMNTRNSNSDVMLDNTCFSSNPDLFIQQQTETLVHLLCAIPMEFYGSNPNSNNSSSKNANLSQMDESMVPTSVIIPKTMKKWMKRICADEITHQLFPHLRQSLAPILKHTDFKFIQQLESFESSYEMVQMSKEFIKLVQTTDFSSINHQEWKNLWSFAMKSIPLLPLQLEVGPIITTAILNLIIHWTIFAFANQQEEPMVENDQSGMAIEVFISLWQSCDEIITDLPSIFYPHSAINNMNGDLNTGHTREEKMDNDGSQCPKLSDGQSHYLIQKLILNAPFLDHFFVQLMEYLGKVDKEPAVVEEMESTKLESYWKVYYAIISALYSQTFSASSLFIGRYIPYFQLLAYQETHMSINESHLKVVTAACERTRQYLVRLDQEEKSQCTRALSMCRCLLHSQDFIRESATDGLCQLVQYPSFDYQEFSSFGNHSDQFRQQLSSSFQGEKCKRRSQQPSSTITSKTNSFVQLMDMICSTSFETSVQCTATEQLIQMSETQPGIVHTLLTKHHQKDDEKSQIELFFEKLAKHVYQSDHLQLRLSSIILMRSLLSHHLAVRQMFRQNWTFMESVIYCFFDDRRFEIQVELCQIMIALTLSEEVWSAHSSLSTRSAQQNHVPQLPAFLISQSRSFSLYSDLWQTHFHVQYISIDTSSAAAVNSLFVQESDDLFFSPKQHLMDVMHLQFEELESGAHPEQQNERNAIPSISKVYQQMKWYQNPSNLIQCLFDMLQQSKSHRQFINLLYYFKCCIMCTGLSATMNMKELTARFSWSTYFNRFFQSKPTSISDEFVLSSILDFFSLLISEVPVDGIARLICWIHSSVLSFLSESRSSHPPAKNQKKNPISSHRQLCLSLFQLLFAIGQRKDGAMFIQTFFVDTNLLEVLNCLYLVPEMRDIYLQSSVLQLLHLLLSKEGVNLRQGKLQGTADQVQQQNQIPEMTHQLFELLSRSTSSYHPHRFYGKNILFQSAQCLQLYLRISEDAMLPPPAATFASSWKWCKSLISDRDARIRASGFGMIHHVLQQHFLQPSSLAGNEELSMMQKMVKNAFDVMQDPCECPHVRGKAGQVVLRSLEYSLGHQFTKVNQNQESTIDFYHYQPQLQRDLSQHDTEDDLSKISILGIGGLFHFICSCLEQKDPILSPFILCPIMQMSLLLLHQPSEKANALRLSFQSTLLEKVHEYSRLAGLAKIISPKCHFESFLYQCQEYTQIQLELTSACKFQSPVPFLADQFHQLWVHRYQPTINIVAAQAFELIESLLVVRPVRHLQFYIQQSNLLHSMVYNLATCASTSPFSNGIFLLKSTMRTLSNVIILYDDCRSKFNGENMILVPPVHSLVGEKLNIPLHLSRIMSLTSQHSMEYRLALCPFIYTATTMKHWKCIFTSQPKESQELIHFLIDLFMELRASFSFTCTTLSSALQIGESNPTNSALSILMQQRYCGLALGALLECCSDESCSTSTTAPVQEMNFIPYCIEQMREEFAILQFRFLSPSFSHESKKNGSRKKGCPSSTWLFEYRREQLKLFVDVLSSTMHQSPIRQSIAQESGLTTLIMSLWKMEFPESSPKSSSTSTMKKDDNSTILAIRPIPYPSTFQPHQPHNLLMEGVFKMVLNYVYKNDGNKRFFAMELIPFAIKKTFMQALADVCFEVLSSIMLMLSNTKNSAMKMKLNYPISLLRLLELGFQILQSLVLHSECRGYVIKIGLLEDVFCKLRILHQLDSTYSKQAAKRALIIQSHLPLITFLSNCAFVSSDELNLFSNSSRALQHVLLDCLSSSSTELVLAGCYLLRNLSFYKESKNCLIAWSEILTLCSQHLSRARPKNPATAIVTGDDERIRLILTALWCLVYDHQKACSTMLQSLPSFQSQMVHLQHALAQQYGPDPTLTQQASLDALTQIQTQCSFEQKHI